MGSKKRNRPERSPQDKTPAAQTKRLAFFQERFREDLEFWISTDPRTAVRLLRLVEDALRHPFKGIGKPEPLKRYVNTWSRRLTDEDRMIYMVRGEVIEFMQARFHYDG